MNETIGLALSRIREAVRSLAATPVRSLVAGTLAATPVRSLVAATPVAIRDRSLAAGTPVGSRAAADAEPDFP